MCQWASKVHHMKEAVVITAMRVRVAGITTFGARERLNIGIVR